MQEQSSFSSGVDSVVAGRPWWKACLIIGGIGFAAVILVGFLLMRYFSAGDPVRIKVLPENFPESFTVYRPERISEIYYASSEKKNKPIRFILAPLRLLGGISSAIGALPDRIEKSLDAFRGFDTVTITWSGVESDVDEVSRFFAGAFLQAGMTDPQMRKTSEGDAVQMVGSSDNLNANLLIVDTPDVPGVDRVTLTLDYAIR